jgi:DNA-directed RNA polymerase specialized sigma24 family protein
VRRVSRRRATLALKSAQVESEFRAVVVMAHDTGHSLREIARAAGVSHVRVLQIIREERR